MTEKFRKIWSLPPKRAAELARAFKRREQEREYLKEAVAIFGEDTMRAIIEAVRLNSEQPLANLPPKWRAKAIAGFRKQFRKKR